MIYTPIIKAANTVLTQVFFEKKDTSNELKSYFKAHKELGSKDRKYIAAMVYFVVRWWKKLQYSIGNVGDVYSSETINSVLSLTVKLLGFQLKVEEDLPLCSESWIEAFNSTNMSSSELYSIPDWMYNRVLKECGDSTNSLFESLNKEAHVAIRLNRIKSNHQDLQAKFKESNITYTKSKVSPDGYIISRTPSLVQHELYITGVIEFQDEASQQMLALANPSSGSWILDICAGKGGKAIHAASIMENKGVIIASDIDATRLKELERRARRAEATIIQYDTSEMLYKYRDSIDMVLIDAPCSGLGTLMRKPDVKWKLKEEDIENYIEIQKNLLETNFLLVKKGGKLVYAACSILPSEGEEHIKAFILAHPDFELVVEERCYPHIHETDGFYVAVLQRKG